MPTCYRPTTLKLASAHCPRALDFYEANTPHFREHFAEGIAAHDCLAAIGELALRLKRSPEVGEMVTTCKAVTERLITTGRTFEAQQEPPMTAEDAFAGQELALRHATREDVMWPTQDVWYERGLGFDASWRAVPYNDGKRRFRLILDVMGIIEDGDENYTGRLALVRDYKSAWPTDASELNTYQMKAQAVAAALVIPDIDGVRREVVNLRTGQVFRDDTWIESGGRETLAAWREEIAVYMDALDAMLVSGKRPARPGVGCVSCPYVRACDAAANGSTNPQRLAQELAMLEGRRAQLIKMLKPACAEQHLVFDQTAVGWHVKAKREPKDSAALLAWDAWQKSGGDVGGFLTALTPSLGGLENVAGQLFKDDDDRSAELLAQWIETKTGREFGVRAAGDRQP